MRPRGGPQGLPRNNLPALRRRPLHHSGWTISASPSLMPQCPTVRPSRTRMMSIEPISIRFPVGGMPMNSPSCVPVLTTRAQLSSRRRASHEPRCGSWESRSGSGEHLLDTLLARLDARKPLVLDQVVGSDLVDDAFVASGVHALLEVPKDARGADSHQMRSFPFAPRHVVEADDTPSLWGSHSEARRRARRPDRVRRVEASSCSASRSGDARRCVRPPSLTRSRSGAPRAGRPPPLERGVEDKCRECDCGERRSRERQDSVAMERGTR